MLVLGIDTCCMPATSAVYDGEKLVGEAIVNCGKTHSQKNNASNRSFGSVRWN